jgi:DNA-binding NtrC family response regulator
MMTEDMRKRMDVLLVDDDEEVRGPIADLLRIDHDVRTAVGLREAVGELVSKVPDAIVCELDLQPYRGDVLLSLVAREHPSVRRVLYTFWPPPRDNCLGDVAHKVLIKPGTLEELLAAIAGDD